MVADSTTKLEGSLDPSRKKNGHFDWLTQIARSSALTFKNQPEVGGHATIPAGSSTCGSETTPQNHTSVLFPFETFGGRPDCNHDN